MLGATVKSFRLYKPLPVTRPASTYTSEERPRFEADFRPRVKRYRRRLRIAHVAMILFAGMLIGGLLAPKQLFHYFALGAVSAWVIGVLTAPRMPTCPACENLIDVCFGEHFPECGAGLDKRPWLGPLCPKCGKRLLWGRRRNFKVRYCTHCGLELDEAGF